MKVLNVEVILYSHSLAVKKSIIPVVRAFLEVENNIRPNTVITRFEPQTHSILHNEVKAIIINEVPGFVNVALDLSTFEIKWHVYTLDTGGCVPQIEESENEESLNIATHLVLPSEELYNLWENLFYDNNIKENLLLYAQTMMEFSDKGVDCNIINCNRVVLLHGPPGTGKTSLCKAVAQKLAVRLQDRYTSGLLIEINTHSLFSKWFSESGKLVTKMFTKINEIVENPNLLVCVLIDEVESLAHARNQCTNGNEPSDSIRVVNAVLTQLDHIRRHSNVLILSTSNITESIDIAFIDRADIKQYLGLPTLPAIYKVYQSCLQELVKTKIISNGYSSCPLLDHLTPELIEEHRNFGDDSTKKLIQVCEKSVGLSGRTLRKIPFIAHALFLSGRCVDVSEFLDAMDKAICREKIEREHFENANNNKAK